MPKILYFDENKDFAGSLESLFASYQCELTTLDAGEVLLAAAIKQQPDLIIMDAGYAEHESFETCKSLKKKRKTAHIPVLFLAAERKETDIRHLCMQAGGDDCLIKPLNIHHLVRHALTLIRKFHIQRKMQATNKEVTEIRGKFLTEIAKLHQANREIEETAFIDRVTGIYNRSHFESKLKEEFNRALRYATPLSLVILDVDAFGQVNERFGHEIGDYFLMKIANVLQIHSRFSDTVCRLEGADFAVIMPVTDTQGGVFEAERLRVVVNQTEYIDSSMLNNEQLSGRLRKQSFNITASFGVATYPCELPMKNEAEFFSLAKKALSQAKASGRNKTISAADLR